MEVDALAYSELNKPQYESGCKFISDINLSEGDKVLDIGCGTGDLSKYMADIVGLDGLVFGLDPDIARVNIAKEKFKDAGNIQFYVGSSATEFPHENEEYYDLHISTHVFHWLNYEEKKLYLQKAYQCLKPGGKLAIFCPRKFLDDNNRNTEQHGKVGLTFLSEEEHRQLLKEVLVFPNAEVKNADFRIRMESFDEYKRWVKATTHHEYEELDPAYRKEVVDKFITFEKDDSITMQFWYLSILASKN